MEVKPVKYEDLEERNIHYETSSQIRNRISKAMDIQLDRYKEEKIFLNSQLSARNINKYCILDNEGKKLLKDVFSSIGLSDRA
ncbi:hypothetical protein [Gottschalkia purinilytica]|uniref:magnesium chelatase subunit ChlI family protein n=1 Tax=Gottschalkia purinilytica TaxID=1503 RepID=UPI003BEEFE59